jgi:FkbM family methyltransferase
MSLRRLFRRTRKPGFAHWGFEIRQFRLPLDGVVQYAQWLHPLERTQTIAQAEVDGLRRLIRPGDFAIDVGAHTGDTTVPMALAAGPSGCVLALEPNPYVFRVLEMNAGLNPAATRIIPQCFAATERDGAYVFHYSDASFCNGGLGGPGWWNLFRRRYPLAVAGRNLLEVLRTEYAERLPRLRYVKVDAEGHDAPVLRSILPVLRDYQPVVRAEVFRNLNGGRRRELFDLLAGVGYDMFRFEGGASPQGAPLHRDALTREKHFDVLALPRSRQSLAA